MRKKGSNFFHKKKGGFMGFDKTSNDRSVQQQPSPVKTPVETPIESPKETGKYSSGAPPMNGSMTRVAPAPTTKIYRD
jgi:hypothetical protein